MSKTVSLFVFAPIVNAAVNAAESGGGFVQSIVDARLPMKTTPSESQIDAVCIAMADAFRLAGLDFASLKVYESCARKLLACPMAVLLAACEAGTGRNGVMKRVVAATADTTRPKRGRPAGNGAGKTTAVNSGAAVDPLAPNGAVKEAVSPMHYWVKELNALNAGATILRDTQNRCMSAEDAVALKDAVSVCVALLGKYTK